MLTLRTMHWSAWIWSFPHRHIKVVNFGEVSLVWSRETIQGRSLKVTLVSVSDPASPPTHYSMLYEEAAAQGSHHHRPSVSALPSPTWKRKPLEPWAKINASSLKLLGLFLFLFTAMRKVINTENWYQSRVVAVINPSHVVCMPLEHRLDQP